MLPFGPRINITDEGRVKLTLPCTADNNLNWYNHAGGKFSRFKAHLFFDPIIEIYAMNMDR